ncbi:unnamed protein product [Scytosiphon promiscuus]
MLSGMFGKEAHFLDWYWLPPKKQKKKRVEWPGDGHEAEQLGSQAVGNLLSAYADRVMQAVAPSDRDTMATVESTPVYAFFPLAPFRMKMILPHARLVVILRDPTERYYSHLRMAMCWTKPGEEFVELEKRQNTLFHNPGDASGYLEKGAASYVPYTPLCRGVGATASDLADCWRRMQSHNPLHRGLYADQLERWFRVYDRSQQILILESSEMFSDFVGALDKVTEHIGLPPHSFDYDSRNQHSSSLCETRRPDLFAKGKRYDRMREDENVFRDWYRPHNQRLSRLLGRELPWE